MDRIKFDELSSLKRYFYLVALTSSKEFTTKHLCRDLGVKVKQSIEESFGNALFRVDRAEYSSNVIFYGGSSDFSVNGDGNPPFLYDIFLVTLTELNVIIVAFPFRSLARELLNKLLTEKLLLKKSRFVRCDIDSVLRTSDENDMSLHNFSCFFSGLDLQLKGETSISSVNLDGDRPLLSPLYKTVFRELLLQNKCRLESCHLKGSLDSEDLQFRTRLSVSIDIFGNYRLYIYKSGRNIFTLPALFTFLNTKKCLVESNTNPLLRLSDELS